MPFASRARAVCRHLGASLLVAAVLPGALAIAAEEPAAPTPPAQATGPAADAPPVPPAPATEAPPADAPATDAPATDAPPTAPQPSAVAPAEAPPADVLPAAAPVVDPPDEVPAASVPLEPQPAAPLPPLDVHAPACSATAAACLKNNTFALWPRLRLRTGYQYVADDPQILYIGRNDGFALDSARIGVDGALRDTVRFRLVIETASLLGGTAATPVTPILAALRDAWVQWTLAPALAVSVGQQFMPSDIEGMTTIAANPFSQRSVATSGVRAGQGIAVTGLSPTRQLGVVFKIVIAW